MKLTDEKMEVVGEIKSLFKNIILNNHGNTIDNTINIFKEVVNENYKYLNLKIMDIRVTKDNKIQTFISLDEVKFDFELNLNVKEDDFRFDRLINECEPWREKNPNLVESDRKIKEWANNLRN